VIYLRRHLVLEPWVTAGPGAGMMVGSESAERHEQDEEIAEPTIR
jgi:hypothetical protein